MRSSLFAAVCFAAIAALSAPAAAAPGPSIVARSPQPSAARRHEARAPAPSAARRHDARAPQPSGSLKRKRDQQVLPAADDASSHLCPMSMNVCPIAAGDVVPSTLTEWIAEGFECVDFKEDLTSCGGCGSIDAKFDCTAIPGADGVSCNAGACRLDSCKAGFTLAADGSSCL